MDVLLAGYGSSSSDEEVENQQQDDRSQEERRTASLNTASAVVHQDSAAQTKRELAGSVQIVPAGTAQSTLFVRSVPHVRGNWAGHVFLQIQGGNQWRRQTKKSVERFRQRLQGAGWSGPLVVSEGLHVSLSRPFFLQLASIENFVKQLKQRLASERQLMLTVTNQERLLVNEEQTRSFLCWSVAAPSLLRLIHLVDGVLENYQQPKYYESPQFHVSLASVPGNVESLLQEDRCAGEDSHESSSEEASDSTSEECHHHWHVPVSCLHCSFGTTKLYRIDLLS